MGGLRQEDEEREKEMRIASGMTQGIIYNSSNSTVP
jgi:hypothetical protein